MAASQVTGEFSDFTSVLHREEYPSISPSRPELSQEGRTVLITGGSDGIGFGIAKGFITASAATVIIIGRSADKLARGRAALEEHAREQGKNTRILAESCDATDKQSVDALWDGFRKQNITVHVLVLNAARFATPQPLLEIEDGELWAQFEANVHSPYEFAKKFYNQPGDEPKSLLYVSTMGINHFFNFQWEAAATRTSYVLTKNSGTLLIQLIARDVDPAKMQVISFHPGNIFTPAFKDTGIKEDSMAFENISLPSAFAVWAASKEARFLHGRYVWAPWDVDELKEKYQKKIEEDPFYLRLGIIGLKGGYKA